MLTAAITTFITCLVLFVVMAVVVSVEQARGRRIFLASARGTFDRKTHVFHVWIDNAWNHFTQYIVRLGWYYSIHSLLKTTLRVLVSVYTYIENIFERNRLKTKELRMKHRKRANSSHFTKIADHKAEVALSKEEQEQLRTEKLENDH